LILTTNALVVAYKGSATLTGPSSEIATFKFARQGGPTVSAGSLVFPPKTARVASGTSDTALVLAHTVNTPHMIGIGIRITRQARQCRGRLHGSEPPPRRNFALHR
jgi:hypothetical protein